MAAYWIAVAALNILAGALYPAVFFLGFWEAVPVVLLATWLAPRIVPRLP